MTRPRYHPFLTNSTAPTAQADIRTLTSDTHAVARGATLRRQVITVPTRLARPQRRRVLHLPAHWPWATPWTNPWSAVFATGPPAAA